MRLGLARVSEAGATAAAGKMADGPQEEGAPSAGSLPRRTAVTKSEATEEEEPVTASTQDHPLKADPSPAGACNKTSASLGVLTPDAPKERVHLDISPKDVGSCELNCQEELEALPLNVSPQEQPAHRERDRRQSWRRASMKGMNRRKSLAPFHRGITELSRSISVDLPENKRLGALLLSSFQFAVQKLEPFLSGTEGFNLENFRAKASSLSEELKHLIDKMENDGTLQKCFENSKKKTPDLSLEASVNEMKEYIKKFSSECEKWDQLLTYYQKNAEEMTSRLTESKITEVEVEPTMCLGSSQKEVLNTKPNYQKILQSHNRVFDYVELVMDELQASMKQLRTFMSESTQYFQKVSVQLGKRSTQQLDPSPARKLLKLQP